MTVSMESAITSRDCNEKDMPINTRDRVQRVQRVQSARCGRVRILLQLSVAHTCPQCIVLGQVPQGHGEGCDCCLCCCLISDRSRKNWVIRADGLLTRPSVQYPSPCRHIMQRLCSCTCAEEWKRHEKDPREHEHLLW